MDEFLERVDREQERRGLVGKPPPSAPAPSSFEALQQARRIEDEPRSRFMVPKLIGISIWGIICLVAFLVVPGVGAAGAAIGLFYAVLSGTFERRPSQPALFDIANILRRR